MITAILILLPVFIASAFWFAYEEYCEWMELTDQDNPKNKFYYDEKEHYASIAQRFSLLVSGYLFAKYGTMIMIPFLLGIYWLCTDGLMNVLKKREFFFISNVTSNPLEKLNVVKFALIILGIGIIVWHYQ